MVRREIIHALIVCSFLFPLATDGQDLSKTVLPITGVKVGFSKNAGTSYKPSLNPLSYLDLEGDFGTAFCVDAACRFIGTNYHVAINLHVRKIRGERVIQRYLATGPDDEGAVVYDGPSGRSLKFTPNRDLAIFELRHALRNYHGIGFSLDDLEDGQEVDIYAYPLEQIVNAVHRTLQKFHGSYKGLTTRGLLVFDWHSSDGKAIRGGASGGIVVDYKTQEIVGILSAVDRSDERFVLAVPIKSLVEFVSKAQPYLAESAFPGRRNAISPVSADLYPRFIPTPVRPLQRRTEEALDVRELRKRAQAMADSMRNFIAVQTFAWGSGDKEPAAVAAYEVRIVDGYQRFREYPDGKEEFQDVPFPPLNTVFTTGGEWSELPGMVGTELRLRIHQAPDVDVGSQRMKVFQYEASIEDRQCTFKDVVDFVLFSSTKILDAAVYGEVWTDQDMNILRISKHCDLPDKTGWKGYQAVVTYGWLKRADQPTQLIPVTIVAKNEHKGKTYWCRGLFTDYHVFVTRAKVLPSMDADSEPPH